MKCNQLRIRGKRSADGHVVIVPVTVSVDPRKTPANRRIVRLIVNTASAVAEKSAAFLPDARAPFSPPRLVHKAWTMIGLDCRRFLLRDGRTICAARRRVRAREARQ